VILVRRKIHRRVHKTLVARVVLFHASIPTLLTGVSGKALRLWCSSRLPSWSGLSTHCSILRIVRNIISGTPPSLPTPPLWLWAKSRLAQSPRFLCSRPVVLPGKQREDREDLVCHRCQKSPFASVVNHFCQLFKHTTRPPPHTFSLAFTFPCPRPCKSNPPHAGRICAGCITTLGLCEFQESALNNL
jgi:hypothetical protein